MPWWGIFLILFASMLILIAMGFWVAIALAGATLVGFLFVPNKSVALQALGVSVSGSLDSYTLTAGVLFMLMGQILLASGVTSNGYSAVRRLFSRVNGSSLYANVVACGLFSAVTGSSLATASAMGSVGIPELKKRKYELYTGLSSLAAGGTLGTLIPPSVLMIIFGAVTGANVAALFSAGIIPGVIMIILFCLYIWVRLRLNPSLAGEDSKMARRARADARVTRRELVGANATGVSTLTTTSPEVQASMPAADEVTTQGDAPQGQRLGIEPPISRTLSAYGMKATDVGKGVALDDGARSEAHPDDVLDEEMPILLALRYLLPVVVLIFLVMGSIYGGWATPTDAGAVGAVGAVVVGGISGKFSWGRILHAFRVTTGLAGLVGSIVVMASAFKSLLVETGAAQSVANWIVGLGLSRWELLLAIAFVYLFLGGFVDSLSLIYITIPVLLPVFAAFNINLVWVAVLIAIHVEMGQITPPVGLNLFVIGSLAPGSNYLRLVRASIPYGVIMFAFSIVVYLYPSLALWLPAHIGGQH